MKKFYAGRIRMPIVLEENGKLIFLQAGKTLLWIFNHADSLCSLTLESR